LFPNSRPKLLLLHLKQFDNTLKTSTSRVSFPATMIKEGISAVDSKPELLSSDYSFMSAIHRFGGSPDSGHYTADALRPVQDAKDDTMDMRTKAEQVGFNFDDSMMAHQETSKITADPVRQQTA
jgi:Ubiquitin carboxyl-terminal hydrolase